MMNDANAWEAVRRAVRDRAHDELERLATAVDADPNHSEALKSAVRAELTIETEGPDVARRALLARAEGRPLGPHESLVLARLFVDQPRRATTLLNAARRAGLEDPRIAETFGALAIERGRYDEAVGWLEQAILEDAKSWQARFALGLAFANLGRPDDARRCFEEVVKIRPDHELSWLGYAQQSVEAGRAAEAVQVLEPLAEAFGARDRLQLAYADCLFHSDQSGRALVVLAAVAERTRDDELLLDFAEMCLAASEVDTAEAALERVADRNARAAFLEGALAERAVNLDGAIAGYERALELDRTSAQAQCALGLLLMRDNVRQDLDRSGRLLVEASREPGPHRVAALANLALLRLVEGKPQAARKAARRVQKTAPPSSSAARLAAQILDDTKVGRRV